MMPAEPTSPEPADEPDEFVPASRADRRAAARAERSGRAVQPQQQGWQGGKSADARGAAPSRRQYSNRRSGG
jgi:hypothetical protein